MLRTLLAGLLLFAAAPLAAQDVDRIEVDPTSVTVASGDTVALSITAFDADGSVVEGAPVQGFVNPFSLGALIDGARFVAGQPASGVLALRVGSAVARVDVVITPAAAAEVAIGDLPGRVVAGSVMPLSASARSAAGALLDTDVTDFSWSTSDPSIATVDPLGNLVTRVPGAVTVTARHRSAAGDLRVETPTATGAEGSATITVAAAPTGPLSIAGPDAVKTGEVGYLTLGINGAHPRWFVTPGGAYIDADGGFYAEQPGTYLVEAVLGERTAEHVVSVSPRAVRQELRVVGRGPVTDRLTGDLRVFTGVDGRDYAYLGTAQSNALLVFDVTDPAAPVLTDSITTDARFVLDVKVNEDATVGVFGREGAANRANGIVILDLADPAHPTVFTEYTETLSGGVHNTFFDGDYIYATHAGDLALHVIDVSDPTHPRDVGSWSTGTPGRYLHDHFVKDGIAYLAYWSDGLIILDVGGGGMGGSPENPVKIGQLVYDAPALYGPGGGGPRGTHTVYVDGDIAYVGDEVYPAVFDLTQPIFPRGYIHIVDVSDKTDPVEVAKYEVPEAGAHNHWVEEGRMYSAYYQGGVRVIDVEGEMRGDLYDQGREVASFETDATASSAYLPFKSFAFGAQLHKGRIYISDMSSGLWVLEVTGEPRAQYPAE